MTISVSTFVVIAIKKRQAPNLGLPLTEFAMSDFWKVNINNDGFFPWKCSVNPPSLLIGRDIVNIPDNSAVIYTVFNIIFIVEIDSVFTDEVSVISRFSDASQPPSEFMSLHNFTLDHWNDGQIRILCGQLYLMVNIVI